MCVSASCPEVHAFLETEQGCAMLLQQLVHPAVLNGRQASIYRNVGILSMLLLLTKVSFRSFMGIGSMNAESTSSIWLQMRQECHIVWVLSGCRCAPPHLGDECLTYSKLQVHLALPVPPPFALSSISARSRTCAPSLSCACSLLRQPWTAQEALGIPVMQTPILLGARGCQVVVIVPACLADSVNAH